MSITTERIAEERDRYKSALKDMSDVKANIEINLKTAEDEVQRLIAQNKTLVANNIGTQENLMKQNQDLLAKNESLVSENISLLTCVECDMRMDNKSSLNAYIKTKHIEHNVTSLRILKDYVNLQESLDEVNKKNAQMESKIESLLTCDVCSLKFEDRSTLKNHMETLHDGKKYECNKCGEGFQNNHDLNNHMFAKHDLKRMICQHSEIEFSRTNDPKRHMSKDHEQNDKKQKLLHKLNHLKTILGQQKANIFQDIVELKQREFRTKYNCRCKGFCQINHSRYSWVKQKSDSIIELLRKTVDNSKYDNNDFSEHPKERSSDLICLHCNSILKDRPSLRSHINVHHESNLPMECEQCNQLITNKSNITTHRES